MILALSHYPNRYFSAMTENKGLHVFPPSSFCEFLCKTITRHPSFQKFAGWEENTGNNCIFVICYDTIW